MMFQPDYERSLARQRAEAMKIVERPCLPRHATKRIVVDDARLRIVAGIRFSGKTFTTLHALAAKNIPFAYVDLSDRTFFALGAAGFAPLLEALAMVYGKYDYVLVDEFLSLHNWRECIQALIDAGKRVIALTSAELNGVTLPEGAERLDFYPLSFSEYCIWQGLDPTDLSLESRPSIRAAFDDFLTRGGFPQLRLSARPYVAAAKLADIILQKDLRGDFRKTMAAKMSGMANALISLSPEFINYKELTLEFAMRSEVTVKKYVEIIKDSGILVSLKRFALQEKVRDVYEKLYLPDPVFISPGKRSAALETVVFLQLRRFCRRHGYSMHYYANRRMECDFALCVDNKMRTIIQVMDDYGDSAAVKEKVAGLISLSRATGCGRLFIITDSVHDDITARGLEITVIPAYEFLLDRSHKIV